MSIIVSAACKQVNYTGAKRAVLLEFADHANDDGICWPSRGRIMYNTGLSESAVKQQMRALREAEILVVVDHHEGGRGRVPIYKVVPAKGPQKDPFSKWAAENLKGARDDLKGAFGDRKGGTQLPPEPSGEPSGTVNLLEEPTNVASTTGRPVVPMEKYIVNAIYEAMDEAGYKSALASTDYGYHLGAAKRILKNDSPTDEELEELPASFVNAWEIRGRADAALALMELRRQKARKKVVAGTAKGEKRKDPDEWKSPYPDGEIVGGL